MKPEFVYPANVYPRFFVKALETFYRFGGNGCDEKNRL